MYSAQILLQPRFHKYFWYKLRLIFFQVRKEIEKIFNIFFWNNLRRKGSVMKKEHKRHIEDNRPENDTSVMEQEKVFILSKTDTKRNLDQTIRSPERYVSWYHYNTKNIDKYLTLCPHCKKPTLSAFNRAVIDSAIDYLNGKRMFRQYSTGKGNGFSSIIFLFVIGTVIYFLLNYL